MNPNPAPAETRTPTLYGYPAAVRTLPRDGMSPMIRRLYEDALAVLTEPDGPTARLWAAEIEEDGFRAITRNLTPPQVVSLVSELPARAIARFTGIAPSDGARREIVRALCAEPED